MVPAAIQRLTERLEPRIRKAFLQAVQDMTTSVNMTALVAHIEAGNTTAIMRALNLQEDMLWPMEQAIRSSYADAATYEIGKYKLPDPDGIGPLVIRFDGRNPRAETWVAAHSSKLIVEILEDQRQLTRMVLQAGLAAGQGPRQTALDLVGRMDLTTKRRQGGLIGLTSQEAGFVMRARNQLQSGTQLDLTAYLERKARDKRFDRHVLRSLRTGEPIPAEVVSNMTQRYSDRLLKLRGERIARTETLTSLNAGRKEGFDQIIETAGIPQDKVSRIWRATGDNRTRETHLMMDGQEQAKDEPFTTPDGYNMMFPGDVSLGAPASETIQCRCYMEYRIDYLGMRNG